MVVFTWGMARQVRIEYAGAIYHAMARGDRREPIVKGDWRKRVIGRAIRRTTIMPVAWIAEVPRMGDPKRAASLVQSDPNPQWGREWKKARHLLAKITKNVDCPLFRGRAESHHFFCPFIASSRVIRGGGFWSSSTALTMAL